MPISRTQGKRRSENYRIDELPHAPETALSVPDQHPVTKRFVTGNRAARRRTLKRLAKNLAGLDPDKCQAWLRPFVIIAGQHSVDLIADLPVQSTALNALAIDTATACAVYRGLLALGAQGDMDALGEARQWLREHRQSLIALTGLGREEAAKKADEPLDHDVLSAAIAAASIKGTP